MKYYIISTFYLRQTIKFDNPPFFIYPDFKKKEGEDISYFGQV